MSEVKTKPVVATVVADTDTDETLGLHTKRMECGECGHDVCFTAQHGFDGPDLFCDACGHKLTDHAYTKQDALSRFPRAEDASGIALKYTFDEIMDIARRCYDADSRTEGERNIIAAFNRLVMEGLPCCAPPRLH